MAIWKCCSTGWTIKQKKHPKWHGLHPHSSMHHGQQMRDAIWTVQMGHAEILCLKLVHLERTHRVPPHPGKSMQALRSCWADGYFRFWERDVYQLCLPRTGDSYTENKNKSNVLEKLIYLYLCLQSGWIYLRGMQNCTWIHLWMPVKQYEFCCDQWELIPILL